MSGWSKDTILKIIQTDISSIRNCANDIINNTDDIHKEFSDYLATLIEQIPNALSGPLIPKTPKVPRKKVNRIETIPEDEVAQNESKVSDTLVGRGVADDREDEEEDTMAPRASRRAASLKAYNNIKKQQAVKLNIKMRRPSCEDEDVSIQKPVRASRAKRTKSVAISSDEEEAKRPAKKHSNSKPLTEENDTTRVVVKVKPDETYVSSIKEEVGQLGRSSRSKRPRDESVEMLSRGSSKKSREPAAKKANIANETMNNPEADVTVDPSLYEDAVGKSIPMNSTMNPNTTVTFDRKMMNVTVVLESMQMPIRINETVTVKKSTSGGQSSRRDTLVNEEPHTKKVYAKPPLVSESVSQSKSDLQDRLRGLKETMVNKEFNALITDDESSPERPVERKAKKLGKTEVKTKQRTTRSNLLSDDDDGDTVPATPTKTILREVNGPKAIKNSYKTNVLFSPWAKDSVKKRVEAFEQAQMNSPKSADVDAPTRVTRTKTRAMAAAEAGANQPDKSIVQKAARETSRKSLAKAMKIALMKEMRENEERKENNTINSAQKPSRLLAINDKLIQKQQQRTTPVGKSRLQMPMSVNRIQHTPAGSQIVNQNKAQTVSRSNIIMSVDSFLPQSKTLTKTNSTDNLAEKKRKMNDEDARRKKDEALKAKTEEKKRKREEKELRNKLAREANEKLDIEKRLKLEREREEKAKAAQWLQEKQREESERKRLVQLQRAQEKEERRRQEEQLRLQRLQEQEEAERQLAEQKRREQEAERRRQAEARAQHLAAAEAARMKALMIAKGKLANNKNQQGPMSYKLDSEPDDDDSDDESRPKNPIPYWALPNVRKAQLKINHCIPMAVVCQFFGAQRCTPDLTELFKGIKKERLQRTSSAIWKTPPRYSVMMLNEEIE